MSVKINQLTSNLLSILDNRQRDVIENRYGLKDGHSKTLAEIGRKYHVTRERIRQIEDGAAHAMQDVLVKSGAKEFTDLATSHLRNIGGIRRESLFLNDLKLMVADPGTPYLDNKVRFILEIANEPGFIPESRNEFAHWYLKEDDRKRTNSFIAKLVKLMENRRGVTVNHQNIDSLISDISSQHKLKDLIALNYVSVSKHFHINEYGDFGLFRWPEINPKTMRDWAYLVLKKNQKPLHFTEVAKLINQIRKNYSKSAHPQTVHNELIKDRRFVLVGRGTYGLQEMGNVQMSTAKEIINRLLEKHGPLKPKELLSLVLKERFFKNNTIFINLQNKKHFKRLDDGRYTVNLV